MPKKESRQIRLPAIRPQDQMAAFANLMALAAVRGAISGSSQDQIDTITVSQETSVKPVIIELCLTNDDTTASTSDDTKPMLPQPDLFGENL